MESDPDLPLLWIDCEMTGLDAEHEQIIEIAAIITKGNLELVTYEIFETYVHASTEKLESMNEWCLKQHKSSGLWDKVLASNVTPQEAANGLYKFVMKHIPKSKVALLAGSTVHMDKTFLVKEPYKKIIEHLHHRIYDVSSIKEAARRACPDILNEAPKKMGTHTAYSDIIDSIEEARYYQRAIFQPASAKALKNLS